MGLGIFQVQTLNPKTHQYHLQPISQQSEPLACMNTPCRMDRQMDEWCVNRKQFFPLYYCPLADHGG
jgi:hypothetical protein